MTYSTCEISRQNAREWAARASDSALKAWNPCGIEGCFYCDELVSIRNERFAPPPPVDRNAQTTTDGRSPVEVRAEQQADGNKMHKSYIVLTPEERAKGFQRPVRRSYRHVGVGLPADLQDLTDKQREQGAKFGYVKYQPYGPERAPIVGMYWTQADLDRVGKGCGAVTTMGQALAETYARDPSFYSATMCATCGKHFPVGEKGEFVWEGTEERVGT